MMNANARMYRDQAMVLYKARPLGPSKINIEQLLKNNTASDHHLYSQKHNDQIA